MRTKTLIIAILIAFSLFFSTGCTKVESQSESSNSNSTVKLEFRCNSTKTKTGKPCRNLVKSQGLKCYRHREK